MANLNNCSRDVQVVQRLDFYYSLWSSSLILHFSQGGMGVFLCGSLDTINCNSLKRAKQTLFPPKDDEWGKSVACCLYYFPAISSSIRNWRRTILWIALHSWAEGKIDPILRARQFSASRQQVEQRLASWNANPSVHKRCQMVPSQLTRQDRGHDLALW